jgi:hypothetical protein
MNICSKIVMSYLEYRNMDEVQKPSYFVLELT